MRDIIFKAKRLDNGEWIQGDLRHWRSGRVGIHDEVMQRTVEVDSETVGQYSGLHDENGKLVFEGDIVQCGSQYKGISGVVNFNMFCFCVKLNMQDAFGRNNPALDIIESEYPNEIKVVGNIHDNPELIEGVK